jgi:hypothetical protein
MKTVRFYNMMIDCVENGINTVRELGAEFRVDLPEDFDLNDAFGILTEKTGYEEIFSFRYEVLTVDNT